MPDGKDNVIVIPVILELLTFDTVTLAVSVNPQMVIFLGAEATILSLLPCADRKAAKKKARKKTSMRRACLCMTTQIYSKANKMTVNSLKN
jgi:hypothetical protein